MTLNNERVVETANRYGLKIDAESLVYNDSGLDFQVVFANDLMGARWVLRFPRREDVVQQAKKEKHILELVEPRISVQAPRWDIYSEALIAYRLLSGTPAGTIDVEAQAYVWEIDEKNVPDLFHDTLGKAMVSLHGIDHEVARKAGLSVFTLEEARNSMRERMDKVKAAFGVDHALWTRWQTWLDNDAIWPKRAALIHGDLHAGHVLIDEESRVTGIIDWTEARVADPANDFGAHLATFGEDALKSLISSYKNAGGYVWSGMYEHVIEVMAAYPVSIAEFAQISGMEDYVKMAKQALGVEK